MRIKPDIKDQEIIDCLRDAYSLNILHVSFLPLGADFNTAVYRVTADNKADYFLKLRSGGFCDSSVMLPEYLSQLGLNQVIAPITTKSGEFWTNLNAFKVILYPYIDGSNGLDSKLSDQQWLQLGATIKKLHTADIPKSIISSVPEETFSSRWCETAAIFLERVQSEVFKESVAAKMALFLKSKSKLISNLIKRTEELRTILQNQSLEYVLCHADIHGWNLLIGRHDDLYLVDWDTLILAPKERDLMFIGACIWDSSRAPSEEELLFYQGYGKTQINQDAICYYRFERIIQDISEYCEYIFLSDEGGDDRVQSFEYLQTNFLPNGTIQRACHVYDLSMN